MSFLDSYIENNQLPALSDKVKGRLDEIEKRLNELTQGDEKFADIIPAYMDRILKIVEEIKLQFKDWKPSAGSVVSSFRFIIDIANEVAVIVKEMSSKIVPAGATADEARNAKIAFGKELTYFIYMIWDPRILKKLPVGIESWIEKKVIYFVSGMVIDWALDYLEGSKTPAAFTIRAQTIGALPKK